MTRITSTQDPLRILLIEDSKGDVMLIQKALQSCMLEAHMLKKSPTLGHALKTLSEHEFDVALLDRSLPDAEGFSGLHSIQNMAPQLPIVFLTAYKDEAVAFEAIEQGAQDYLYKDNLDGHIIKRAIQYAILRKQFEGVLIMRANFDMLTGLANRMLFESRLEMALAKMKRQGGMLAVFFLDLNRFKQVNDTLGHAAGDILLKEIGRRLKSSLRPYDTSARFGGDEFALLLEGISQAQDAHIVANKVIRKLSQPFDIGGDVVDIGVSVGVATCAAGREIDSQSLMKQADAAMYEAKSQPGSTFCIHEAAALASEKIARSA